MQPGSDHWSFLSASPWLWNKSDYPYCVESHSCEWNCCTRWTGYIPLNGTSEPEILLQASVQASFPATGVIRGHVSATCRSQAAASMTPFITSHPLSFETAVHTSVEDSSHECDVAAAVISQRVADVCLFPAPLLCFGYQLRLLSFTSERQKPGHSHSASILPITRHHYLLQGFFMVLRVTGRGIFNEKMSCRWFLRSNAERKYSRKWGASNDLIMADILLAPL